MHSMRGGFVASGLRGEHVRHQSLLAYAKYRWAKIAFVVIAAAIAAYAFDRSPHGHYGGSALGYTLGTIGVLLIAWLTWFGVRKRRYGSTAGTLLGWLSAHVYLGVSLLVIATLHAAFEVGWNVHTLAYALMVAVILSGFYGVYAYLRHPRGITDVLGDDTQESLLLKIADLDRQMRTLALSLPDAVNRLVLAAAQGTRIGGGFWAQLSGSGGQCPTDGGGHGAAVGRQDAARQRRPGKPAALRAHGAQAGAGRPRPGRRQAEGAPRRLALPARAADDRAARRARRARRQRVLLLVGA